MININELESFYQVITEEDKNIIKNIIMYISYFIYRKGQKEFTAKELKIYMEECSLMHSNITKVLKTEVKNKNINQKKNNRGIYSLNRNIINKFDNLFSNINFNNKYNYNFEEFYNIVKQLNIKGIEYKSLENKILELKKALDNQLTYSIIFLSGSILETIFLYYARNNKDFLKAKSTPKYNQNIKSFDQWKLNDLIIVAKEIGLIKKDVESQCHIIKDYRNYIHPNKELKDNFAPDLTTAELCFIALSPTCKQILQNKSKIS